MAKAEKNQARGMGGMDLNDDKADSEWADEWDEDVPEGGKKEEEVKLKVRSCGVEDAWRMSELIEKLPIKSEAEKFSVPDNFIVYRNQSKSGIGFESTADPSVRASGRVELESLREQHHKVRSVQPGPGPLNTNPPQDLAELYIKFVGCGSGGKLTRAQQEELEQAKKKRKPNNHSVAANDVKRFKEVRRAKGSARPAGSR